MLNQTETQWWIQRGFGGGVLNPNPTPFGSKLFHFHREFLEKLGKLIKSNPTLQIWTPYPKILDPPLKRYKIVKTALND